MNQTPMLIDGTPRACWARIASFAPPGLFCGLQRWPGAAGRPPPFPS